MSFLSRFPRAYQRFAAFSSSASFSVGTGDSTTVGHVMKSMIQRLETAEVPEAENSVAHLLGGVLDIKSVDEIIERRLDHVLNEDQLAQLDILVQCRLGRMPVQYILKEWDFLDLTLTMKPPVFIPRYECYYFHGYEFIQLVHIFFPLQT